VASGGPLEGVESWIDAVFRSMLRFFWSYHRTSVAGNGAFDYRKK
jgi:hypothetical protein